MTEMTQDTRQRTSIEAVDSAEVQVLLENMDSALREANGIVEQLSFGDPADLAALDYKQLKAFEQTARRAWVSTEDARKSFKREWEKPMKRVEEAFKAETAAIKDLYEAYKAERVARDELWKDARFARLRDVYEDFCVGNGVSALMENVPFERIAEGEKWLNRSEPETKCEEALIEKVSGILRDWQFVQQTPFAFPEEAARCFFRTLSLREVAENDGRLAREEEARRALEAEVAGNRGAGGETEEPEPPAATDGGGQPPETSTYLIEARMTPEQFSQLLAFFRGAGIHGTWRVKE